MINMSFVAKHIKNYPKEVFMTHVRHSRSKPFMPVLKKRFQPQLYYSLKERLAELDETIKSPELYKRHNIGFVFSPSEKRIPEKWRIINSLKEDSKLEKKARDCKLNVELDEVESDWNDLYRPLCARALAENSDIFMHLFGDYAYFYPIVQMDIYYDFNEDSVSPVYFGNLLKPKETSSAPSVSFKSKPEDMWTLVLTNPDGNLYEKNCEVLHWFIGNIPGEDIEKGEVVVDYLRPIPPKGTGFHRFCFILYKQHGKIDFSQYKPAISSLHLKDRTFKTFDFYKRFEDQLTPAGLSWYLCDYDATLSNFFHEKLGMMEPIYEYEFPKPYLAPQKHFPMLRPFNRYMDLHRDPKEMQKLMLLKRLAKIHPFQGEPTLLSFPQASEVNKWLPAWMKYEIMAERDGKGKYRDVYRGDDRPFIVEGKRNTFPFSDLK